MSEFPVLKTGSVMQYPAQKETHFSTQVVRFVDGSEQRFRDYQRPLHRWVVRLELLDEGELHLLQEFFRTLDGPAGAFTFTDPWDGTKYPNCSFESDDMMEDFLDELKGKIALTVCENRG
jgi:phage-related protein